MIIDPVSKKAYTNSANGFVDASAAMNNVSGSVLTGVISNTPVTKSALAMVYLAALEAVGEDTIDLNNLKFTLLDDAASFNEADTTIGAVTDNGARENVGGNWPVGGVKLNNASAGMEVTEFQFKADAASFNTFGTTLSWRYGVIYDATSGTPLIFFDYYGEREIAANRNVRFEQPSRTILRVRK